MSSGLWRIETWSCRSRHDLDLVTDMMDLHGGTQLLDLISSDLQPDRVVNLFVVDEERDSPRGQIDADCHHLILLDVIVVENLLSEREDLISARDDTPADLTQLTGFVFTQQLRADEDAVVIRILHDADREAPAAPVTQLASLRQNNFIVAVALLFCDSRFGQVEVVELDVAPDELP